jgi:hypothetical protein
LRARARDLASLLAATSALSVLVALATGVLGCGAGSSPTRNSPALQRAALSAYLRQVEPVRPAVNRLLDGADPILSAYRSGRLTPRLASARMQSLERRFAAYTADVAAIVPATPELRVLHGLYAHTYILEDAYLAALASGLAMRQLEHLPDTQAAQRAAIIQWRTGLTVLAGRLRASLPSDLQAAGRGEIAPALGGS